MVMARTCHPYCLSCFDASLSSCYGCSPSYYQSGNTCDTTCADDYGPVTGSNICIECDPICLCCEETPTNCTICLIYAVNNRFLSSNSCLDNCTSGTFCNATSYVCEACPGNCSNCTSGVDCTLCDSGWGLLNSSCYDPCLDGYWMDGSDCSPCDPLCLICSASATNCSECTLNGTDMAYLLNSTCVAVCPN